MKKTTISRLTTLSLAATLLLAVACNKEDDTERFTFGQEKSVAVSAFHLKDDSKVLNNLDTVFFSIDLENAVIFNADSLPAGTVVTDLIPVITYTSSCSEAVITQEGGSKRTGEVNYKENPNDSIDFSGKVSLRLTAEDGVTTRTYRLKVNVHTVPSDTLSWGEAAYSPLPSRMAAPMAQKTVNHDETAYCMVREADGTLTVSSSKAPAPEGWQTMRVQEPANFDIATFAASDDAFYILDTAGRLFSSPDAKTWSDTGKVWKAVTGGFASSVLGVAEVGGRLMHVSYPENYPSTELEEDFPVSETSNLGVFTNKWSIAPIGFLVGGRDSQGRNVNGTWAFDGYSWARISQAGPSAVTGGALVPYYIYRLKNNTWNSTEFSAWLLLGGRKSDGTPSRDVWLSYDNGVNWQKAVDYMQLPEAMPALCGWSPVVLSTTMSADLKDLWKKAGVRRAPARINYETDGYDITWQCPYIYLFGGYDQEGNFSPTIWRGVLNKLKFMPLL